MPGPRRGIIRARKKIDKPSLRMHAIIRYRKCPLRSPGKQFARRTGRRLSLAQQWQARKRRSISSSKDDKTMNWKFFGKCHSHLLQLSGGRLDRQQFEADAINLLESEREAMWKKVLEINHHHSNYLAKVERRIPSVWLKRR